MHILIINRYALTPQQAGGTRHYSLARELQNLGNKLQLVAGSSEITKIKHEDFFTYLPLREGVSYFSRLTAMVKFFFQIVRYKSWLKDKPDVIIGTSPDLFQAFAAWWVAHRLKIPFVLEVRDLWPDSLIQLGNMSPWHPLILLFRRMEMWLYRRAQRIVRYCLI